MMKTKTKKKERPGCGNVPRWSSTIQKSPKSENYLTVQNMQRAWHQRKSYLLPVFFLFYFSFQTFSLVFPAFFIFICISLISLAYCRLFTVVSSSSRLCLLLPATSFGFAWPAAFFFASLLAFILKCVDDTPTRQICIESEDDVKMSRCIFFFAFSFFFFCANLRRTSNEKLYDCDMMD